MLRMEEESFYCLQEKEDGTVISTADWARGAGTVTSAAVSSAGSGSH